MFASQMGDPSLFPRFPRDTSGEWMDEVEGDFRMSKGESVEIWGGERSVFFRLSVEVGEGAKTIVLFC